MALQKCPRCELNYILDDATYCTVCSREMKGEKDKGAVFETCSICNENPALPGKDLCLFCLKEMEDQQEKVKEAAPIEDHLTLEDASEMEEIAIDTDDDIPSSELGEIGRELSLDEIRAEEDEMDGEDEPEDGV